MSNKREEEIYHVEIYPIETKDEQIMDEYFESMLVEYSIEHFQSEEKEIVGVSLVEFLLTSSALKA